MENRTIHYTRKKTGHVDQRHSETQQDQNKVRLPLKVQDEIQYVSNEAIGKRISRGNQGGGQRVKQDQNEVQDEADRRLTPVEIQRRDERLKRRMLVARAKALGDSVKLNPNRYGEWSDLKQTRARFSEALNVSAIGPMDQVSNIHPPPPLHAVPKLETCQNEAVSCTSAPMQMFHSNENLFTRSTKTPGPKPKPPMPVSTNKLQHYLKTSHLRQTFGASDARPSSSIPSNPGLNQSQRQHSCQQARTYHGSTGSAHSPLTVFPVRDNLDLCWCSLYCGIITNNSGKPNYEHNSIYHCTGCTFDIKMLNGHNANHPNYVPPPNSQNHYKPNINQTLFNTPYSSTSKSFNMLANNSSEVQPDPNYPSASKYAIGNSKIPMTKEGYERLMDIMEICEDEMSGKKQSPSKYNC